MNAQDIKPIPGELVADWAARVMEFAKEWEIRPSATIRIEAQGPNGTALGARWPVVAFEGAFDPTLSGSAVKLAQGFVESVEPLINGVPISGDAKKNIAQPSLALSWDEADQETFTSWICLEVEGDKYGQITKESRVEVVHVDKIPATGGRLNGDKEVGMCGLALVTWSKKAPASIVPRVLHSLTYMRTFPGENQGAVHHYFAAL